MLQNFFWGPTGPWQGNSEENYGPGPENYKPLAPGPALVSAPEVVLCFYQVYIVLTLLYGIQAIVAFDNL